MCIKVHGRLVNNTNKICKDTIKKKSYEINTNNKKPYKKSENTRTHTVD